MTDIERERIKAICEVAGVSEIDDLSDGFHTFRQLYYQRMMLFATIVKQNHDKAWKSLRHEDGELCFGGGWFIVGIDTPEGSYTYHYENKYFDLFDCEILDYGKHWDGHTEKDVTRLLSLPKAQLFSEGTTKDTISRQAAIDALKHNQDVYSHNFHDDPIDKYTTAIIATDIDTLVNLPSVQPEPHEGHWIRTDCGLDVECKCSKCGYRDFVEPRDEYWFKRNYCPNCGAKMKGAEHETD